MLAAVRRASPERTFAWLPADEAERREAADLMGWLAGRVAKDGKSTAWVCRGYACQAPVQSAAELTAQLGAARG